MQIVIDILEDTYKNIIKNGFIYDEDNEVDSNEIKNGITLSKGHGRLIDADKLNPDSDYEDGIFYAVSIEQIGSAETIVAAESEE